MVKTEQRYYMHTICSEFLCCFIFRSLGGEKRLPHSQRCQTRHIQSRSVYSLTGNAEQYVTVHRQSLIHASTTSDVLCACVCLLRSQ